MIHSGNILASLDVNEIYNRKPIWLVRWGTFIFLVIIVLLFFSTWYIKYPEFISAPMIFDRGNHSLNIYSKNNGIIKYINFNDGDTVKNGDVIAILENAADFNSILLLKTFLEKNDTIVNKKNTEFLEKYPFLSIGELYKDFASLRKLYFDYKKNKDDKTQEKYWEKLGYLKNSLKLFEFRYLIKSPVSGILSINKNTIINKYTNVNSVVAVVYPEENNQISGRIKVDSLKAQQIKIGQKVFVYFEESPKAGYSETEGTIRDITFSKKEKVFFVSADFHDVNFINKLKKTENPEYNSKIILYDISLAERTLENFKKNILVNR